MTTPVIDAAHIKQVLQSSDVSEVRTAAHSVRELTQPNSPEESKMLQLQIMLWNRIAKLDGGAELECCQTIGALWTRMNEPEKAIGQLSKGLALDANDPSTHSLIGDAMFQASNYPESIKAHQNAIELWKQRGSGSDGACNKNLATAYSKLGSVLESKGDFEQAIETLNLAKSLVSGEGADIVETQIRAELHAKLGTMHDHLGNYVQAAQELEQAICIYTKLKGEDDAQVQELAYMLEMAVNNAKE
ncbi:hypothetical protein MPSEU_000873900 [Mayamaea pseudoterrestris]|nr:hypothetical protein MPSEU_000873900 [Mayamaea pseudoterrestris]